MFEDLKIDENIEDKNIDLINALKDNIKIKQKLIDRMITDIVAKNLEIMDLKKENKNLQDILNKN